MGFFLLGMKFFGLISRFVNGSCCVRVAHTKRMALVSIFTFFSFVAISYACSHDTNPKMFNVAIGASIFTGIAQSFGEAVYLGFLKGFPSDLIGDVSTGTGVSGILATFTLFFAKWVNLSNQRLFLIEAPTMIIYYLSFKWLDTQRRRYPYVYDSYQGFQRLNSTQSTAIEE